jgi:protein SCO1/2
MADSRSWPIGTLVLGGVFLLVMLATYVLVKPPAPPPELQGVLRSEFKQIGPFQLSSTAGGIFDDKNLRGKWSFIFFGYLSCPDICPTTLHTLGGVQTRLKDEQGEDTDDMQVVFISVDPQRDNIEMISDYVTYFNKKFIGATAAKTEIDNLARQFAAGYVFEEETAPGQYLVAHTSAIFLVDPFGRLVAVFSQPHYPSTLFTQYKKIRAYFSATG